MFDLLLKNARIVVPGQVIADGQVAVNGEKVAAVGTQLGRAKLELDLQGQVLFPGMFDPHTHLGSGDERSYEYMGQSFERDTKDCLIGGVTSIATTTVLSPTPLPQNIRQTIETGDRHSRIDYRVTSVVLNDAHVEQMPEAISMGCRAFKFYCGYCMDQAEKMGMSREGVPSDMFYRACEQVARADQRALLMVHAEEPHVRRMLGQRFKEQGRNDLIAWAEHSPQWSEAVQVLLYAEIAQELKVPLYVVHISRAPTLDLIDYLRARGHDKLIAETVVAFLSTTAQDREACGCGFKAKIQPPIRFEEDKERLWKAIAAGVVTSIGTDTIPYTSKYKSKAAFWDARPGLNIQTIDTLPLLLTEGYHKNRVDLPKLAALLSENPARYFGAGQTKGKIAPGYDADFVVIDLEKEFKLGHHRMRGGSDYSIWEGQLARGLPTRTYLRGQLVAENGEVNERSRGQYIRPEA